MATLTNSVSALLTSAIIPFVPLEAYFLHLWNLQMNTKIKFYKKIIYN